MISKINSRRGATSISILLLTIMALFLAMTALFVFAFKNSSVNSQIGDARIVESVYAKQEIVNYYLAKGMDSAEIQGLVPEASIKGNEVTITLKLNEDNKDIIVVKYVYNK